MSPVLGFSLNTLANDVGLYVGLAAVLGVAVLALLFFAQARELKRLREWADAAPERAQELEERLTARAHREPQAAPAAASAPVAPAARAAGPAAPRPAPAGVGAPALASATRFPGAVATPRPSAPSALPAAATAAAAARVSSGGPAPGTNGGGSAARPPIPVRTDRPAGARRPVAAPAAAERAARSPRRRVALLTALALLGLAVVAGVVLAATQLGGGGQSSPASRSAAPAAGRRPSAGRGFSRGSIVVTVLNGTPVPHLANQVASRLRADGFARGTVTNASDQQRSATIISYVAGHRRDALSVSRALGISDVQSIDPATRSIACPQPACSTTVVVTVGSDRIR